MNLESNRSNLISDCKVVSLQNTLIVRKGKIDWTNNCTTYKGTSPYIDRDTAGAFTSSILPLNEGENVGTVTDFLFLASKKSLLMVTAVRN